jgi:sn-glycerol 3-phosphate transport system ATP-binding protein
MARITLDNVLKSFGKTEVIHGISCDIADGEFLVILGPSGCGKSTVLRMIAGLEVITDGEIAIDGKVVNRLEPAQRDIAMVFQNYALYPHMSVYNNMAYGLKIQRMPKDEIEKRVRDAALILELTDLLQRKPRELSGGQRQRVAMGRCIVREPKAFLFDEPLSNLDAKLRVQMRFEIRRLHENLNITSVYVTHDQVEAMTLGDRLLIMNNGHAEQIGSPLAVYERPANTFVAGFIGSPSMNFFKARVTADGRRVELKGGFRPLLPEGGVPDYAGQMVTVGMRPEHLALAPDGNAEMCVTVNHSEMLGADTLVHSLLDGDEAALTVRLPGIQHVNRGERLNLTVLPSNVHLFDHASGKRIGTW